MSITSFPNDMTPLSIDINAHDQETLDHQLTNGLVNVEATRDLVVCIPHLVLMFPLNTVIAWYKTYYEHMSYANRTPLLFASRA